ncbi:MAG TPA: SRPBCC family protein [Solirubrobacteraceae bacterium]|jgi:hypothetical protein|nr:SRPBCC family protein [Solirubrobacteraceae bacterium]
MKPVTVSTIVERTPAEVFAYLNVLANHEAFTDHFIHDWQLSGPAAGVGACLRASVSSPGGKQAIEVQVIEAQPPSRIVEHTTAAEGRRVTRGTYRIEPLGNAHTGVTLEIAAERTPALERFVSPLVRLWIKRVNIHAMQRLRCELESASSEGG